MTQHPAVTEALKQIQALETTIHDMRDALDELASGLNDIAIEVYEMATAIDEGEKQ